MLIEVDVLLFSRRIQKSNAIISWQFTFNKHTADPTNWSTHYDLKKRRGGFKERQTCFVFYSETSIMDVCSNFYGLALFWGSMGRLTLGGCPHCKAQDNFLGCQPPNHHPSPNNRSTEEKCLGRTNSIGQRELLVRSLVPFSMGKYVWANQGVGLVWPFGSGWRVHADWKHSRRVVLVARLLSLGCSLWHREKGPKPQQVVSNLADHHAEAFILLTFRVPNRVLSWLAWCLFPNRTEIKADRECNMVPCGGLQVKDVLDVFIDQVMW